MAIDRDGDGPPLRREDAKTSPAPRRDDLRATPFTDDVFDDDYYGRRKSKGGSFGLIAGVVFGAAVAMVWTTVPVPSSRAMVTVCELLALLVQRIVVGWPATSVSPPSGLVTVTYCVGLIDACVVLPNAPRFAFSPSGCGSLATGTLGSPRSMTGE